MIVVCRRERETVSFVRILVIAWIVSAPSRSGRGPAGAGDVEEALSEEDPWGENIEGTTDGTITGTIAGHTVQAGTRC